MATLRGFVFCGLARRAGWVQRRNEHCASAERRRRIYYFLRGDCDCHWRCRSASCQPQCDTSSHCPVGSPGNSGLLQKRTPSPNLRSNCGLLSHAQLPFHKTAAISFLQRAIERKGAPHSLQGRELRRSWGVLASWFEGSLRNYWWWAPFRSEAVAKHRHRPSRKFFRFSIPWSSTQLLPDKNVDL